MWEALTKTDSAYRSNRLNPHFPLIWCLLLLCLRPVKHPTERGKFAGQRTDEGKIKQTLAVGSRLGNIAIYGKRGAGMVRESVTGVNSLNWTKQQVTVESTKKDGFRVPFKPLEPTTSIVCSLFFEQGGSGQERRGPSKTFRLLKALDGRVFPG